MSYIIGRKVVPTTRTYTAISEIQVEIIDAPGRLNWR